MTKNLRRCLRFFSYILKQRETDITDDIEETLFRDWLQKPLFVIIKLNKY